MSANLHLYILLLHTQSTAAATRHYIPLSEGLGQSLKSVIVWQNQVYWVRGV